jgi:hypothetical protein
MGKWSKYDGEIRKILKANPNASHKEIAFTILGKHDNGLRQHIGQLTLGTVAEIDPAPHAVKVDPTAEELKQLFKKKDVYTFEQLSDHFDIGVSRVKEIIRNLVDKGYNYHFDDTRVVFSGSIPKSEEKVIEVKKTTAGTYRFGVTGDNHLGSRYERLDVLNSLYNRFQQEGIHVVYNTGNWIDGEARFNKHDLHTHGMDNQIRYFIENYPQREGIVTHYITGDDHEGWYTQREGINVGAYTENMARKMGRNDLVFLGHMEADVVLKAPKGETRLRVLHPGGGSSYAISYTSQKIVESYTGAEKPHILLDGHYHKAGYNYIRGVHVIQTGCTQDQTPFMRKKRLAAHLGGWIIEFSVDESGAIVRFQMEWIPYYDNNYHKDWGYQW